MTKIDVEALQEMSKQGNNIKITAWLEHNMPKIYGSMQNAALDGKYELALDVEKFEGDYVSLLLGLYNTLPAGIEMHHYLPESTGVVLSWRPQSTEKEQLTWAQKLLGQ